jgi:hypothetical protein
LKTSADRPSKLQGIDRSSAHFSRFCLIAAIVLFGAVASHGARHKTTAYPTRSARAILLNDPSGLFDPLLADGFDYPVGNPDGEGDYHSPDGRTHKGWYLAARFGERYSLGIHTGEDWNGRGGGDTDLGQPVYSVARGRVLFAQEASRPFGNIVQIEHRFMENGRVETVVSQYDHLEEVHAKVGETVDRRQRIGTIGKGSDDAFPAHLHFELRRAGMAAYAPEFWPSSNGWTESRVRELYEPPSQFIGERRNLLVPSTEETLLVAIKHTRKMFLYRNGKLARAFEIAVSQNPVGPKEVEGDNRLPEGRYRIVNMQRGPFNGAWWARYLGAAWMKIDYPNPLDAELGLRANRIDMSQYQAILSAHRDSRIPPQHTPLGGGIGIHGWIEPGWDLDGDRAVTWGCISMQNRDLLELFDQVKVGTSVIIWP